MAEAAEGLWTWIAGGFATNRDRSLVSADLLGSDSPWPELQALVRRIVSARMRGRPSQDREDLEQDALLDLLCRFATARSPSGLAARITHDRVNSYYRSLAISKGRTVEADLEAVAAPRRIDPERVAVDRSYLQALSLYAKAHLSGEQQWVLHSMFLEGRTFKEGLEYVASERSIEVNSVRRRLRTIQRQLRQEFGECDD